MTVTPCVGVWIETNAEDILWHELKSHPAWVCGLKRNLGIKKIILLSHTLRGCVD